MAPLAMSIRGEGSGDLLLLLLPVPEVLKEVAVEEEELPRSMKFGRGMRGW